MTTMRTLAAVAIAAVLSTGCGSDDPDGTTDPTSTTTSTTAASAGGLADFDWSAPEPTALEGGWTIADCAGDAPVLCLTHEDGRTTKVEHLRFELPGGTLREHAARYVADLVVDRAAGCGEDYHVDADLLVDLDTADGPVLRYGFLGGTGDVPTERTVQWAGERDGGLVLVTLAGFDAGSCLAPEGDGTVADVGQLIDGLDTLISAAGLPDA